MDGCTCHLPGKEPKAGRLTAVYIAQIIVYASNLVAVESLFGIPSL
jgi:hypothetical protein